MSAVRTMQILTGGELVTGGVFTAHATGAVTRANSRISAIDGTAFADASAANVLTDHEGDILVWKDSAGKVLVGYIKAAGTGETFDTSAILNGIDWTGATGATHSNSWGLGRAGTFSIVDSGDGAPYDAALKVEVDGVPSQDPATKQAVTVILGGSYLFEGYFKHGTATQGLFRLGSTDAGIDYGDFSMTDATWTQHLLNLTSKTTLFSATLYVVSFTIGQYELFDEVTLKQRLTPSATGVTIVSTPGGATYNWAYQETGFNYNDAGNYTYEIYDTDFLYGTGWYPSSNTAVKVAGTASDLTQLTTAAVAGTHYQLGHVDTRSAGTLTPEFGSTDGAVVSASGTTSEELISTDTDYLKFKADATFAGTADTVSCKQLAQHMERPRRRK